MLAFFRSDIYVCMIFYFSVLDLRDEGLKKEDDNLRAKGRGGEG